MSDLPTYREIADLIDAGKAEEAKERVAALRDAAMRLWDEVAALRAGQMERERTRPKTLIWDRGVYWERAELGSERRDGPFCQQCKDANGRLSRLQETENVGAIPQWWCSVCGSTYPRR